MLSLRRFISGRGQAKEIRSDNGTNFVGLGHKKLRDGIRAWNKEQINDFLAQKNITCVFHPPGASHHAAFGNAKSDLCVRFLIRFAKSKFLQMNHLRSYFVKLNLSSIAVY